MDPEEVICSKCYRMRPIDEFHINKQGKRNATCKRHSKKRSLEIDDWENFIRVLRDWNKLDQTEILDGKYTFHLDALPVQFGRLRDDEDAFPRSELNAAMRDLNEIIWTEGAFRFTRRGTGGEGLTYRYHCSQDAMHVQKPRLRGKSDMRRDRTHMDRFPTESRLTMTPCLSSRTLSLSIRHKWHAPYVDTQVPKVVEEMIIERASSKTPPEIFSEVRDVPEAKHLTKHQVHHIWQKANAEISQRDSDSFNSASTLLSEDSNVQGSP